MEGMRKLKLDKRIEAYQALLDLDLTLGRTMVVLEDVNRQVEIFDESTFKVIMKDLLGWEDYINGIVDKIK